MFKSLKATLAAALVILGVAATASSPANAFTPPFVDAITADTLTTNVSCGGIDCDHPSQRGYRRYNSEGRGYGRRRYRSYRSYLSPTVVTATATIPGNATTNTARESAGPPPPAVNSASNFSADAAARHAWTTSSARSSRAASGARAACTATRWAPASRMKPAASHPS